MGKFTNCVFHIANDVQAYWPGQKIEGNVSIELTRDIRVSGIFIFLFGGCQINLHRSDSDSSSETYINKYISVFGNKPNETGGHYTLTAGQHSFAFAFTFPTSDLPSSFEGCYGCIRYWLRLNFELPSPKMDKSWTHYISVLPRIPVHTPQGLLPRTASNEKQVSKAFGIGNIGKIVLDASTHKSSFCPGETILVALAAQNFTNKDMGVVRVTLVQRVSYSAGGFKQVSVPRELRTIQSTKLPAGQVIRWEGEPLEIDLVPPSSPPNSKRLLDVQYYVKVVLEVPLGFNLDIRLPITIGTVTPCGVNFVNCSHGFSKFPYCNRNYEVIDYVPSTVCINASRDGAERTRVARCQSVESTSDGYPLVDSAMKLIGPLGHIEGVTVGNDQINNCHNANGASAFSYNRTEDAPPSYDEAVGGVGLEKVFGESNEHKGAILILRFPLRDLKSVQTLLIQHRESLKPFDGHMINFSQSPLLRYFHFPWPQLTSTAVFYFLTQDKAEKWLDQIVAADPSLANSWSAIIAENITTIPAPNFQHQTLQITIAMFKRLKNSQVQQHNGREKFYRSSGENLGRLIVYSEKPKFLLDYWSQYNGKFPDDTNQMSVMLQPKSSTNEQFEQSKKTAQDLKISDSIKMAASSMSAAPELLLCGEIRGLQSISINSEYVNCEEGMGLVPGGSVAEYVAEDSTSDGELAPSGDDTETVVSVVCYQYPDMSKYLDLAATVFDQELPETMEKAELLGMSVTSVILPGRSLW